MAPHSPQPTTSTSPAHVEPRIRALGTDLLNEARRNEHRQALSEKLMDWATADPAFKVQLFRFVDVFPVLHTPDAIYQHVMEYLTQPGVKLPPGLAVGLKTGGFLKGTLSRTVAGQVTAMGRRFIAGSDEQEAIPQLRKRWEKGIGFSVDLLGEACVSESEADEYRRRYLNAIQTLAAETARWPDRPALQRDHLSPVPRANVSIKISSLAAKVDPADFQGSIDRLIASLQPVLESAQRNNVFINFDMENEGLKDLTLELFMRCCERFDFPAGLAMQAYLRSGEADAQRLIDWTQRTGRTVTVRLVKGAYWDYEMIEAERRGWPSPVWTRKSATDACFERMAQQFIDATPRHNEEGGVKLALGSHNARSIAHALTLLEARDLPTEAIELQMLYGMAEGLKTTAANRGMRIREYVPVGQMIPGMAYLVRRLLENTSNESWLRRGLDQQTPAHQLLQPPDNSEDTPPPPRDPERHALSPAVKGVGDGRPFFNEPHRDFSKADQRNHFARAIESAKVPRVANDTTVEQAKAALDRAHQAAASWRDTDPLERANCLTRAATLFRQRRDELSAIVLTEAGKPWRHADGDVCEAIDFCEYYARQAVGLFRPKRLGKLVGELDEQWHLPRGPAAIISPWNFPMAICTGMTAAALATGNPALVKPAEQTPGIAKIICECLWEAGVPRDVLHFLPGEGETVGAALVRDPRTALICFTGSKGVGLDILRAAGDTTDDQLHVKQVVCEMGGKNATIVDASADPDEAVLGVMHAAFGYSGQRCSACSRAIVLDPIHDSFLERLVDATRSLQLGDPRDPGTDVGHVIDEEAAAKIRSYIELGTQEGRLDLAMEPSAAVQNSVDRPIIGPHIFSGITTDHRLANEEVFGPVLSVMRAKDIDHALEIANSSPYRLTGGLFSRTPSHIAKIKRDFRVGNLYINRDITGSLVGRQPFGGFGLSGTGSKAGDDEYLHHFILPRAYTENTMRRGFAPGLAD